LTQRSRTLGIRISAAIASCVLVACLGAQDNGYIKATGHPGAAAIFVNGQYVGPAYRFTVAEKYTIPAGDVEVTVRDPRYEDFVTKVSITKGKTTKIHYTMKMLEPAKPPFGRLRLGGGEPESFISVAAGDIGAVYINNKYYGYVDELNNAGGGLLLNPGTYDVHISSPKFGEINQKVTIEANKLTIIPLPKER
jgi:hypothetical protein